MYNMQLLYSTLFYNYVQPLPIPTYIYTGLSTGAIVGIVTGCLLILGFVIILFTTLFAKYTRKRERYNFTPSFCQQME